MTEKQITEKIREQILAHIDFANPDEVEVEYCSHTLYSIKYYGVQLDLIAIYRDEETVECDELYEIVFSYDEIERIGQMAMLLDEARDKWGGFEMTREEAIEALEQCVDWAEHTGRRYVDTVPADALKMAFEALKESERRNGKWIDVRDRCGEFLCSNCHETNINNFYKYCPYCGAEMEE